MFSAKYLTLNPVTNLTYIFTDLLIDFRIYNIKFLGSTADPVALRYGRDLINEMIIGSPTIIYSQIYWIKTTLGLIIESVKNNRYRGEFFDTLNKVLN
jgi:hypothetical protein